MKNSFVFFSFLCFQFPSTHISHNNQTRISILCVTTSMCWWRCICFGGVSIIFRYFYFPDTFHIRLDFVLHNLDYVMAIWGWEYRSIFPYQFNDLRIYMHFCDKIDASYRLIIFDYDDDTRQWTFNDIHFIDDF